MYRRYGDESDAPPAPSLPDWCFEDNEQQSNQQSYQQQQQSEERPSSSSYGLSKRGFSKANFMKGVPGVTHFTVQPKAYHLQKKVQVMCDWKRRDFPGCQPVSMDLSNIQLLRDKPYRVSWKADGMRYMMLIDGADEVYFFDRDHNVFKVSNLTFPYRKDLNKHLKDTLLDGVGLIYYIKIYSAFLQVSFVNKAYFFY